ncbi:HAD-IIA family hydrolase [Rhodococcus spelaei]|uniref:HAD-IIA family hydrolase n=1 Tax=Rhodococcus spelaei TaxID=2546320 RepID=A0A541BAM3_9NOCA|nr:HAD-IIA family hydrolase [Rhodococcus spelaei]TQF69392.1 HAD-IIA family hydrolase [Rhodococcus spelaei]
MARIDGVLFDIDGVLVTSWQPIEGAARTLEAVRDLGVGRAFLTNTTSRTRRDIAAALRDCGMDVDATEVVTATALTAEYLRSTHPGARCLLINHGDIAEDMDGIVFDDRRPDVVVLGGAGPEFDHATLSRVVELMLDGVPVVAMQGGLTWATSGGTSIDTGAYLPGLEAAGNGHIVVIGKPSPTGFVAAAELMGTAPGRAVMIGDDLRGDVLAAQHTGFVGVLVRTGKFRQGVLDEVDEDPDHVVDSVADLPELLGELIE